MVMRGAFANTLVQRGVHRISMLFQHDPAGPVGVWLELREDYRGLFARGRLIPEVVRPRRRRAVDRLSHREGQYRSAQPGAPPAGGRPVGDFHRHVPAARGGARACGEAGGFPLPGLPARAVTRAHAPSGIGRA